MSEEKKRRGPKPSEIKRKNLLVAIPEPVLEMIPGCKTSWINEAIMEKLLRTGNRTN